MLRVFPVMDTAKVYKMSDRDQLRGMHDARIPLAHEGVGRALRGAYAGGTAALPADLTALLGKIS